MPNKLFPSPNTAKILFSRIKDLRFPVQVEERVGTDGLGRSYVQDFIEVENQEEALAQARKCLEWEDVEFHIQGQLWIPGEYPFSRYTVVISMAGVPLRGFFGDGNF